MHVHAVKGDAECKFWLYPDRFDVEEAFEFNLTPRLRRRGESTLEDAMLAKTEPTLAKAIRTTKTALVITTASAEYRIPWERCSDRLARATNLERANAVLSPSGYGIHWPLIDEDLAVGPLIG